MSWMPVAVHRYSLFPVLFHHAPMWSVALLLLLLVVVVVVLLVVVVVVVLVRASVRIFCCLAHTSDGSSMGYDVSRQRP